MNMDLYEKTVKRLARGGIKDPTAQITALAEEIERYRAKINGLEMLLRGQPPRDEKQDAIVEAIPQLVQFIVENAPKLVAAQAPGPVQMETLPTIQDELITPQDESMRWLASRFGRRA